MKQLNSLPLIIDTAMYFPVPSSLITGTGMYQSVSCVLLIETAEHFFDSVHLQPTKALHLLVFSYFLQTKH